MTVAAALLVLVGCTDTSTDPDDGPTGSPPPTESPSPPTPTATPTASPSPSPSASPTGPAAEADGCPPAHEARAAAPPAADAVPATDTRTITEAPSGREIDVTVVAVSSEGAAGEQITAALDQYIDVLIDRWDETAGPPPEEDDESGTPPAELQVRMTPARVDETVVSVVLEGFEYLGGASGNGLTDGWVFSTATGEGLGLEDVGLDGPCRDELGTLAADALAAEDVGMFEEAEAELRAGEIPMDRWSLHDGSLHLHFPAYELAPGAAGPLTAELDLATVRAATGTPLGPGNG